MEWLQLLGGGVLLYLGAEWFVSGASALALALRVPQVLVGLTVVAYGTSAPEVIVGVQAAAAGHGDVALGNVVGSNIANVGLILGIAALIRPARVDGELARRELPVLALSALLLPLLLWDGQLGSVESVLLLALAVAYTGWMVRAARSAAVLQAAVTGALIQEQITATGGAKQPAGVARSAVLGAVGLSVLLVGGDFFVDGAVGLARALGLSDRLVGLTIVAVGTSLPELVTSVIAARRGHSDIAVGNVIGSNIFNVLLCLGASGLAGDVGARLSSLQFELVAFLLMSCAGAFFIRTQRTITRLEGATVLLGYAVS